MGDIVHGVTELDTTEGLSLSLLRGAGLESPAACVSLSLRTFSIKSSCWAAVLCNGNPELSTCLRSNVTFRAALIQRVLAVAE